MAALVAYDPGYGARIWPSLKGSCPTQAKDPTWAAQSRYSRDR